MKTRAMPALFVMAFLCAPATLPAQEKSPFPGDWTGTIDVLGQQLRIELHFTLDDKKELTGTMDSLDQEAMGLPLASIKVEGKTITFLLAGLPGDPTFKGTLDEAGTKLGGSFIQGGIEGTFKVERQVP